MYTVLATVGLRSNAEVCSDTLGQLNMYTVLATVGLEAMQFQTQLGFFCVLCCVGRENHNSIIKSFRSSNKVIYGSR